LERPASVLDGVEADRLPVGTVSDLEVHLLAVVDAQEGEPHLSGRRLRLLLEVLESVEVPVALRHLPAADEEVLVVRPDADERLPRRRLALRDLVLVVREDEVDAARVDVDRLAEAAHGERRALEVPAGAAAPEARLP